MAVSRTAFHGSGEKERIAYLRVEVDFAGDHRLPNGSCGG